MTIRLGVIMDPITRINFHKDTTLALLFEAQQKGWELFYFEQKDLFLQDNKAQGFAKKLTVAMDENHWFEFVGEETLPLAALDVILMRKDPPVDNEFIFTTYLLEKTEAQGTLIVNKPQSLRDANEKFFIQWFPQCCPETLITSNKKLIHEFLDIHKKIVLKPLTGMGGKAVFCLQQNDVNVNVIIETLTKDEKETVMAQRFIPEIFTAGDKRIFLVDGEPMPYALVRLPHPGDFRGNIAAGGLGKGCELTERDRWLCEQVGSILKQKGLLFVGLDVVGDYITEINVTSPTNVRQLKKIYDFDVAQAVIAAIEKRLSPVDRNVK